MTNSYLIDTNILLRISRRQDRDYRQVNSALEWLLREDAALYYTHQNIAEFWNVWTRPAASNGFSRFESMMSLAADSAALYDRWRELVLNGADFARYRELITVVDPGSLAEAA